MWVTETKYWKIKYNIITDQFWKLVSLTNFEEKENLQGLVEMSQKTVKKQKEKWYIFIEKKMTKTIFWESKIILFFGPPKKVRNRP